MANSGKTVSLVLGSGGARGLAHIGVIRWLEEHGYRIESVSGASMGALVGGIFAAGKLDEFEHWVMAIRTQDILKLLDLSFGRNGFVRGEKIMDTLRELVGDQQIEDLPVSFTAVATDLTREREVWLNRGSLFDAIRASISLPLFFVPAERNGMTLLDGGILNPVPIAPTFGDGTDLTIAVNLGGKPDPSCRLPEPPDDDDDNDLVSRVTDFVRQLANSDTPADGNYSMLEITDRMFDAMQGAIARQQLASYAPDVELVVPGDICGMLEFDRARQLIPLGYQLAEARLGST